MIFGVVIFLLSIYNLNLLEFEVPQSLSWLIDGEEGVDRMTWWLNGRGTFDIWSYYKAICGTNDHSFLSMEEHLAS